MNMEAAMSRSWMSSISYHASLPRRSALISGLSSRGDDPQHLFVIFIIAQGFAVGCKKGDVMGPGEFPAEFVNIDCFKIFRLFSCRSNLLPGMNCLMLSSLSRVTTVLSIQLSGSATRGGWDRDGGAGHQ